MNIRLTQVIATLAVGLSIGLSFPIIAQEGHQHHAPAATTTSKSESTEAFEAAAQDMHKEMNIAYSGNADIDFVRGMIPHHQGAVAMAEIVLKHGTDPEIRALAEKVIAAQHDEIVFMQKWLAANDKP